MSDAIVVHTTIGSKIEASELAETLVARGLAACVQIVGPISSVYRWQDAIERSEEWLCLIKTQRAAYPQLEAALRECHPYDVPEIVAVPIEAGSAEYLKWLIAATPVE
jgi:periplasmic divalent cation tolerance protein